MIPLNSPGLRRCGRHVIAAAASAMAMGVAMSVTAQPYNTQRLAAAQVVGIEAICRAVVGTEAGTADDAACVESLARTQRAAPTHADASLAAGVRVRPYANASPEELVRREQAACVRMGLAAGSDGYSRCFAGLRASLFAADNPAH
jgi:hypothetical protein